MNLPRGEATRVIAVLLIGREGIAWTHAEADSQPTVELATPGAPPEVAALVDGLTPGSVGMQLVNLHPTEDRELMLQAGAFGEHEFTSVSDGRRTRPLSTQWLRVILKPGAVGRLELGMNRYANSPNYALPWRGR